MPPSFRSGNRHVAVPLVDVHRAGVVNGGQPLLQDGIRVARIEGDVPLRKRKPRLRGGIPNDLPHLLAPAFDHVGQADELLPGPLGMVLILEAPEQRVLLPGPIPSCAWRLGNLRVSEK